MESSSFILEGDVEENIRIVFVDDEIDFLSAIIQRLENRGFNVQGFTNGTEALDYLEQNEVDLVVMDVKMPGRGGLEVLQEIKRRWPLIEVVMLTGHASVESGIRSMEMGAFDYVMKPARLDDLLQKLRQAMERKSLQEEKIRLAKAQT